MTVSRGAKDRCDSDDNILSLWDRVCSMSLIKTGTNVYSKSKESSVLVGSCLDVIGGGIRLATAPVKNVVSSVTASYPNKASRLESLVHDCLDQLEDKGPVLQQHASLVVTGTGRTIKRGIRGVLKSYPGQKVLQGLNTSIDVAETLLESVQEAGVEKPKRCTKGTQISHGDLVRSGESRSTASKLKLKVNLEKSDINPPPTTSTLQVMKYPITIPLKLWIFLLKSIKRTLVVVAGKKHRSTTALLSPDRLAQIKNRKRVSPKKRVADPSFLRAVLNKLARPVILLLNPQPANRDISLDITTPSDENIMHRIINEDRHPEKRKHSDVDEDDEVSSTEDTDDDIYGLDDYISSDDSDFQPQNASTDSLEYATGDTESDLDTEEVGKNKRTGSPLHQIRKTPRAKPKPALQETKDNNQNSQTNNDKIALVLTDNVKKTEPNGLDLKKQSPIGQDKNKDQNNKNKGQNNKNKDKENIKVG